MTELRRKVDFVKQPLVRGSSDFTASLLRFAVEGEKVVLFAANSDMICRVELKVTRPEGYKDGVFSMLGAKIDSLTSQVASEYVTFTVDRENAMVEAGFLTANFETFDGAGLTAAEGAILPLLDTEGVAVNRDAFYESLQCGKSCTTVSSIRAEVTHVEIRGGKLLASDGRKVMTYTHDGFDETLTLKCPASTLGAVIASVKQIEADLLQVLDTDSYFLIKGNRREFVLGIRKIERSFPAVEGSLAKTEGYEDHLVVDKDILIAMLKGVSLGLSSEEVRISFSVSGSGADAKMEVSALNELGRKSFEVVSVGRDGVEPLEFPISYQHLLHTLGVFKGDSVVDLYVQSKMSLLMVSDTTDAREVLTIIPFRTDRAVELEKTEAAMELEAKKKLTREEAAEGPEAESADVPVEEAVGDLDDAPTEDVAVSVEAQA
jgi:hypothetical protein